MRHTVWLALTLMLIGCSRTTPERRLIDQAAAAIGGWNAIEPVSTIVLEGDGENYNLGQNRSPAADLPIFKVAPFTRAFDVTTGRWRQGQMRTPTFPAGNPNPQKQVFGLDGHVAYAVASDGSVTRGSTRVMRDRRLEVRHHPITILRAARADGTRLDNLRTYGDHDVVDVTTGQGDKLTLSISTTTRLPARVVSMTSQTNLGDVAVETEFGDYRPAEGGLKLPALLTTRVDKYTTARIVLSASRLNQDPGDLSAPEKARSAQPGPPSPNVTVEELAPGVWLLAGQSHHSVVVEFEKSLTLIEAPLDDLRSRAVFVRARALRPEKPLDTVVNTHHHFDHSGGIRAAVAEGLQVITQRGNRTFFEDMASRAHAIEPDALAAAPKPIRLQEVSDTLVKSDATMRLELYEVPSPHCDTMLMAYLPKSKILVEVDLYAPPAPGANPVPRFPFAPSLLHAIQARKLKVDRIVPLHGKTATLADLVAAAQ